jgi:phosphoserine phosphatase RsbU/P
VTAAEAARRTEAALLPDAALLVVDDNEDNRYTLRRRLTREGYRNLTLASNGREALENLRAQPFDLVLLDIMMPDMNGYEVLEQVKATPALRDIPIIMISSLDEVESVIRCIELGAEDYLSKPFNPTLLRARVGASLEKKRLRDEIRRNMERLAQELDSARALQLAMLPRQFPTCSPALPIAVHAVMEPAREVGGDLYDCFPAGDHTFCFLVGDVCGKGASAAMFMARARSLVRLTADLWGQWRADDVDPGALMAAVNRELCLDNDERMFVTMFLGVIDVRSGRVAFVNAGHPPPHQVSADGETKRVDAKPATPLGIRDQTRFETRTLEMRPGDALFVCSDGVVEAANADGEVFSSERLAGLLREIGAAEPVEMVRVVKDAVDAFAGGAPRTDDVTALALRWRPGEAGAGPPVARDGA